MNCIAMLLLAEAALGAVDYAQPTTDYSSHVSHVRNFVQDERSAEIDYSTCVWSKPFSNGAMDCETFLDGSVLVGMECTKTNCNTKRLSAVLWCQGAVQEVQGHIQWICRISRSIAE